ncbi:MAG: mechanosensitive ion channel family protein [Ekhidna sp.]
MERWNELLETLGRYYLIHVVLTFLVLLAFVTCKWLIKKSINRLGNKYEYDPNRTAATKRILTFTLYVITIALIVIIWGGDFNNLWITIGSILGVIAIGFFAIWSILSNIVAGIIIYSINPFKISDMITLVEKEISGKVIDIGLIFTLLEDEEGTFTVPNNLFFQQVVKVKKK